MLLKISKLRDDFTIISSFFNVQFLDHRDLDYMIVKVEILLDSLKNLRNSKEE